MGTPWRAIALVVPLVVACNALTGVADLEVGSDARVVVEAGDAGAPPPIDAGTAPPAPPAPPPPPTDGGPKPSYCTGITLYIPFDGSLASAAGQMPDAPPAVTYAAGKFGSALDATTSATGLYYATTYLGRLVYSVPKGSVAMWVNPTWVMPCFVDKVLFKPRLDKSNTSTTGAGVQLECFGAHNGLFGGVHDVNAFVSTPGIATGVTAGWNHLAVTWNQQTPSMAMTLNGGTASTSSAPWTPNESPATYVRIGNDQVTASAVIDEVAIWDHELTTAEIAALASATKSLHDVCGL